MSLRTLLTNDEKTLIKGISKGVPNTETNNNIAAILNIQVADVDFSHMAIVLRNIHDKLIEAVGLEDEVKEQIASMASSLPVEDYQREITTYMMGAKTMSDSNFDILVTDEEIKELSGYLTNDEKGLIRATLAKDYEKIKLHGTNLGISADTEDEETVQAIEVYRNINNKLIEFKEDNDVIVMAAVSLIEGLKQDSDIMTLAAEVLKLQNTIGNNPGLVHNINS